MEIQEDVVTGMIHGYIVIIEAGDKKAPTQIFIMAETPEITMGFCTELTKIVPHSTCPESPSIHAATVFLDGPKSMFHPDVVIPEFQHINEKN